MCRSPGGTPLSPKHPNQDAVSTDPGAIIAQALRRKFAHQVFQDSPGKTARQLLYIMSIIISVTMLPNFLFSSPDKENLNRSDASLSGFDSPNMKLVSTLHKIKKTMLYQVWTYNSLMRPGMKSLQSKCTVP